MKFGAQGIKAGVYRFRVQGKDGVTGATFTGQATNMRHQMASYRNPGPEQLTNQRLCALLKTFCATAGVTVLLEIVASARSKGNIIDLDSAGHRHLLERALIASAPGASLNL
ncbi:MAG: hypothetical protein ABI401_08990 [Candidatus Dormibacter sp.]